MIKLGEVQKLKVKRIVEIGAYLGTDNELEEDVLLPKLQLPEDTKEGDEIEVMVYNDSKDRIVASTKRSKLQVGELGFLELISQTKIGAFLDWGLEKDLFLPFAETLGKLTIGKKYFVGVYIDNSNRLCATMKIQDFLQENPPYKENDMVEGVIYSINRDIGAFVAVEYKYNGLIPKEELLGAHEIGELLEVRVTNVKEDGKLDLSLRDRGHIQMATDVNIILDKLKQNNGYLDLNDNSSPDEIRTRLNISKSAFKRAVGNLYKEELIEFKDNGIKLK